MNSEPETDIPDIKQATFQPKHLNRLKLFVALFTAAGIALFAYFVYSVGVSDLIEGIERFGFVGFAVILAIYFVRMVVRGFAWKLSVFEPYHLKIGDALSAFVIGEAMSNIIPLGILISGTAKAVVVRDKLPLVVGMSSVATENLFYSLTTSIFLIVGCISLLLSFPLDTGWTITIIVLIFGIVALLVFLALMVMRQWHFASESCEWLYKRGYFRRLLEDGRLDVRLFENLIFGFYRQHPKRFLPICIYEAAFHLFGVAEVWFVLSRLSGGYPSVMTSFLLESVSRLITILFKLIPFVIGVDEAGAKFVGDVVALAAGIGITIAVIRKGRVLVWTAIGLLLLVKRGLSLKEMSDLRQT